MSYSKYAIESRTLATECGWNKLTLMLVLCQGLNAKVCMACRDHKALLDSLGDLTTWLDNLLFDHQPRNVACMTRASPQTPAEPMQLGNTCLTPAKREETTKSSVLILWGCWWGHCLVHCTFISVIPEHYGMGLPFNKTPCSVLHLSSIFKLCSQNKCLYLQPSSTLALLLSSAIMSAQPSSR